MRSFRGCPVGGGGVGGGSGGGGVIRSVHRAITAGGGGGAPTESFSPSANSSTTIGNGNTRNAKRYNKLEPLASNTPLSLSSPSSSNATQPFSSLANFTVYGGSGAYGSPSNCSDESEWECVNSIEDGRACVFNEDFVFGNAPSTVEVEHAVSALQEVLGQSSFACSPKRKFAEDSSDADDGDEILYPIVSEKRVCAVESEIDWVEPSIHFTNSRNLQPHGSDAVFDAFHLLQAEPSIQRMVISISSDKAVWDAVLNNEVVKEELRASNLKNSQADSSPDEYESSNADGPDGSSTPFNILNWISINARAKLGQLMDRIAEIVRHVFEASTEGEKEDGREDAFSERCKTSLILSVIVLLIVVASRVRGNSAT